MCVHGEDSEIVFKWQCHSVTVSQLTLSSGPKLVSADKSCLWTPCRTTMLSVLVFALLCTSCLAGSGVGLYSYSTAVGGGSGTSFSTEGQGRITAIRLWEQNSAYITGIQLRYGYIWSKVVGKVRGTTHEMELFGDESIIQVSGKYHTNYIYQLIFVTSRNRFLMAGQPNQVSFNFYPRHPDAGLKMLSGRTNHVGITSLAAHWGAVEMNEDHGSNSTAVY